MYNIEKIKETVNWYAGNTDLNQYIKETAYFLWEKLNKPQNKDLEIWDLAQKLVIAGLYIDDILQLINEDEAFNKACELFAQDREKAEEWLNSPQRALGGKIPIEVARTKEGTQEVLDIIGRLENGVIL